MAVQEPRTGIVSKESDRDIIARVADAHNVTDDGVIEIISRASGAADNVERVAVQINWCLSKSPPPLAAQSVILATCKTHQSTKRAAGYADFDALSSFETVYRPFRKKI